MKNICKNCNYDNSLHSDDKCSFCGRRIFPSNMNEGFHMELTPDNVGDVISDFSAQVYSKDNHVFIELSELREKECNLIMKQLKYVYDKYIESKSCMSCGSLFCTNSSCINEKKE